MAEPIEMKGIREPEEVLTQFPWGSLVRWVIYGAVGLPLVGGMVYFVAQFLLWVIDPFIPLQYAFEAMILGSSARVAYSSSFPGVPYIQRTDLFENLTDLPGDMLIYCVALLALPGGITGCLLYLRFRKREIDLAKEASNLTEMN